MNTNISEHSVPFTPFHGWVKSIQFESLNEIGREALARAFPLFTDVAQFQREPDPIAGLVESLAGSMGFPFLNPDALRTDDQGRRRPRRRYSGDGAHGRFLGRGRYYTVCWNPDGDDGNTLRNELNAYSVPNRIGPAFAEDLRSDDLRALPSVFPKRHGLALFFLSRPNRLNAFVQDLVQRHVLTEAEAVSQPFLVQVPYRVQEVSIPRVIDLRYPETRKWFADKFWKGDGVTLMRELVGDDEKSFYRMWPGLVQRDWGGYEWNEAIGYWMRRHNVDALVYPSARSDVACLIENGALREFRGWCLVDYRGAPAVGEQKWVIYGSYRWDLAGDVSLEIAEEGQVYEGSFVFAGNERYHLLQYGAQCEAFFRSAG